MGGDGVPDAARLAARTEAWLRLLREALPPSPLPEEEGACVGAAASSSGSAAASSSARPGVAEAHGGGSPGSAASPGPREPSGAAGGTAEEATPPGGSSLLAGLERLFGEVRPSGQGSAREGAAGGGSTFRVQVPRQYPGVQYRKSKNLNDRYPRYAKLGTVVTGHVEDDGEWLRISDQVFLPMKVGGVQILEPSIHDALGDAKVETGKTMKSLWFACSQGNQGEEQEVVTDMKEAN